MRCLLRVAAFSSCIRAGRRRNRRSARHRERSKGNVVTNATVTVQDAAKGLERTATSDGQGGYSARLLPPGTYTVTIDAAGFTRY